MRITFVRGLKAKLNNRRVMLHQYSDGDYILTCRRLISRTPAEIGNQSIRFTGEAMQAIVDMWAKMNKKLILHQDFDYSLIQDVPLKHIVTVATALGLRIDVQLMKDEIESAKQEASK